MYVLKAQEVKTAVIVKTQKTLNKPIFCIVSTDSVEEDIVSDTDDEDELSVVAVNEDQNVCITLMSKAILNVKGLYLQKTYSDRFECLNYVCLCKKGEGATFPQFRHLCFKSLAQVKTQNMLIILCSQCLRV